MNFKRLPLLIVEREFRRSPLIILEQEETQAPEQAQPEIPQPESPQPQQGLIPIEKVSETSEEFDQKIQNGLSTVTENVQKLISKAGFKILTASLVSDALQEPSQIPWNLASSAVLLSQKQIVLAESVSNSGNSLPSLNPEGLMRQSLGHVFNTLSSGFSATQEHNLFSDMEGFKYAFTSDVARLNEDKKKKLAFYIEDSEASRSECFAECFAALNGGGAVYTMEVMSKYFPAVMKQIKDVTDAIQSGEE